MGSFDGAECCETLGLYLLHHLTATKKLFDPSSLGLYRDDGLAVVKGPGSKIDRLRKDVICAFQELGFKITTEINCSSADFLDIVLDLQTGGYRPYRKPNQEIRYIAVHSNHPKHVKEQIPKMQELRLSTNSSSQQAFNDAAPPYNRAFAESGYNYEMAYRPPSSRPPSKKKKGRSVLWFNPPFSGELQSNLTRLFLNMLLKHFKPGSELHKLFNKNNTKVSYCCTPNMKRIIDAHNKKLLAEEKTEDPQAQCNCLRSRRDACPLQGKCLTSCLVYRADVTDTVSNNTHTYYGQCMRSFKKRYTEHCTSFSMPLKDRELEDGTILTIKDQIETKKNKSELAAHIWKLKEDQKPFKISWHIQRKAYPYSNGAKVCNLCSWEKFYILMGDPKTTINSRSELFFRCKSQRDCLLSNRQKFKPKPP